MSIDSEFALSFYKELTMINEKHKIMLVQHVETRQVYIKKVVPIYNLDLYQFLQNQAFPNIPAIQDLIIDQSGLVIIEEYITGQNLHDILENKKFTEAEMIEIISTLCCTLEPLHRHQPPIIHRDIKPSNLILDSQGKLYLIDFDAAKIYDPKKERDTVLMGTVEYAAPEQYGFSQSNEKTDIYSIGVLINEMLTGHLPVDGLYKGPHQDTIKKCIAMDPSKRFSDVTALRKNLTLQKSSFLPPGFRQKKTAHIFWAILGYIFVILIALSATYTDSAGHPLTSSALYLNRFFSLSLFFLWIFYFGNYVGFRDVFPYKKKPSLPLEILRIVLGGLILTMIPPLLTVLLEGIFL